MRFGVTFYPDQWPESYWDLAFKTIKDIGFELVRLNEMTWPELEPQPGKFNFSWLDKALNLCRKHNLKVMLGTGAVQAPQWLIKKHPEILPVANDGQVHPPYGPRPNFCRDNQHYRKYAERLISRLAKRYAKHKAIEMWQLDNEPSYPPLDLTDNKDWCHCQATQDAFIKWCKNKYGSIKNLNQTLGTKFWSITFNSFDEITPPKVGMWDGGNPHIYLDWYRFKSDRISSWLNSLKNIIRKYDKVHKIGTNSFTNIPNRIGDHEVISKNMDWFGWDIYPVATQNNEESLRQIADYWRSVCKRNNAEFIVCELQAGPTVRWGDPAPVTGEQIKKWIEILEEHGATTVLFHNFRPPLFGCETGGYGLLSNAGGETERSKTVKNIISKFKNDRTTTRVVPTSNIGIVYLKASEIETYQEEGWPRSCPPGWFSGRVNLGLLFGLNSLAGAYKAVIPDKADFIFQKQLEEDNFNYNVLLLTDPYLLSEKQFDNLKNFVNNGGILVSDPRAGLKDKNGKLRENPLFENWLKFSYLNTEIIPNKIGIVRPKAEAEGFRDIIKCQAGVIAKYSDGHPAIIEKKIGKGKVLYATFSLFSSLRHWENKELLNFVKGRIK